MIQHTQNLLTAILLLIAPTIIAKDNVFDQIESKTWFEEEGFAGTTIIFYKTKNGLLKAIRQINGSGVHVVNSEIYDIEITQDTVHLFNGLDLETSQILSDHLYLFNNTTLISKNGDPIEVIIERPVLYVWKEKGKNINTQIDVIKLKEISIGKMEIYKDEDLRRTLLDERE